MYDVQHDMRIDCGMAKSCYLMYSLLHGLTFCGEAT
jgi:hypothetical protein